MPAIQQNGSIQRLVLPVLIAGSLIHVGGDGMSQTPPPGGSTTLAFRMNWKSDVGSDGMSQTPPPGGSATVAFRMRGCFCPVRLRAMPVSCVIGGCVGTEVASAFGGKAI
ncbi:hypothetical protein NC653_009427 [Populus alba x Populus x berolinensis]|uniref:Uncharacterized protein n=1 Tax=Populus alba x Populus x berolinensis TaxID=444605 RepID=A0AAD6R9D8_9ROSI|nr:hypothetical protein NC653_009427 [Populus alba x Populus x berolinensis]